MNNMKPLSLPYQYILRRFDTDACVRCGRVYRRPWREVPNNWDSAVSDLIEEIADDHKLMMEKGGGPPPAE